MNLPEAYNILRQYYNWRQGIGRGHHPKGLDEAIKLILDHEDK